jgi:hypothetical protein
MARQPIHRKWSDEEDEKLRRLWPQPLTVKSIAARMGRSPDTIARKANALGLPPKRPQLPTWRAPPQHPYVILERVCCWITIGWNGRHTCTDALWFLD